MWVAVGGHVFFTLVKILTWLAVYGWRCFLMKVDAYSSKRCYYSNPCMDYSRVSFCSWFVVVGIIVFRLSGCLMHIPCAAQASLHSLRPRRSAAKPVLGAKLLSISFSLLYSFLSKSQ